MTNNANTRRPAARIAGITLIMGGWLLCSSSCVLEELNTANLCGQFAYESGTCTSCSAEGCCEEERACRETGGCADMFDCLAPCGTDVACIEACAQDHPNDEAGAALAQCHGQKCVAACSSCAGGIPDVEPACDDCLRTSCCDTIEVCRNDPYCGAILQCVASCIVPSCTALCRVDNTVGAPDVEASQQRFRDVVNCSLSGCQAACGIGENYACVGNYDWALAQSDTVQLETIYFDLQGAPAANLTATACLPFDPNCDDPIDTQVTDADGSLVFTLPGGFIGHYEATGTDYVPLLSYQSLPVVVDALQTWATLTTGQLDVAAGLIGTPLDPTRGHLAVSVYDCLGIETPGAQIDVGDAADAMSTAYYFVNGLPSVAVTATTGEGLGGWVNLPTGQATVVVTFVESGQVTATKQVQIRAGTLTNVSLGPDPQ
jgi:hypothetical protein